MGTLLDIGPRKAKVIAGETELEIHGLVIADFIDLVIRFPAFGLLVDSTSDVDVPALAAIAPDVIPEIIACGNGLRGDAQAIEIASTLPLGDQVEIGQKIIELTFPKGYRPFVEQLKSLGLLHDPKAASEEASSSSVADTDGEPVSLPPTRFAA